MSREGGFQGEQKRQGGEGTASTRTTPKRKLVFEWHPPAKWSFSHSRTDLLKLSFLLHVLHVCPTVLGEWRGANLGGSAGLTCRKAPPFLARLKAA